MVLCDLPTSQGAAVATEIAGGNGTVVFAPTNVSCGILIKMDLMNNYDFYIRLHLKKMSSMHFHWLKKHLES